MRIAVAVVSMLTVALTTGCMSASPRGGGLGKDNSFKVKVPMMAVGMKQMETRAVKVEVDRGAYFKQDVRLESRPTEGIKVDPAEIVIKSSEPGTVYLRISAPENASIGEYRVYVRGVPESGETATAEIKIKVKAP